MVEALAFSIYAAYGLSWAAAGTFLKAFMGDLDITLSQASFLTTAVTGAKVAGPFLAGALVVRLGLTRAFLGGALMIVAGGLVPLLPSYPAILAARFAMGLGGAMVVVYFTPLAMRWFPPAERLAVNGLNFVGASVGTVTAMLLTPSLQQALGGSWRLTLALYSLVSLALAAAWLLVVREPGGLPRGDDAPTPPPAKAGTWASLVEAARDRHTWLMAWAGVGPLTAWVTIITYFPTFYSERFGSGAGWWVSHAAAIPLMVGIPSSLAGIALARRLGRRLPLTRAGYFSAIPLLVCMFMAPSHGVALAAGFTGLALFLPMPAFYTIPQELPGATPERAASMMACFWAACYAATTLFVWAAGRLAESHGFTAGFTFIAAVSTVSALGLFCLPETGPARSATSPATPRNQGGRP